MTVHESFTPRALPAPATPGLETRVMAWLPLACVLLLPLGVLAFVVHPKLGLAAVAVLGAPLLVIFPQHALLLLVAALPTDAIASLGPPGTATLTRLLGFGVVGGWVVHVLLHRKRIRLDRTAGWLGAYVGLATASVLWAPDGEAARAALQLLVQLFVLYVMVANLLTTWPAVCRALDVLIAASTVVALVVLWQLPALQGARATLRLGEEAFNPNTLAATLVLPVLAGLLLGRWSIGWWRAFTALPLVVAALVTGSRGGTMALLAGAIVLVIARPRALLQITGVVLAIALLAAVVVPRERLDALGERYERMAADRGSGRLDIWKVGMEMIGDHPLLGVGLAGFQPRFYAYMTQPRLDPEWAREARNRYGNRAAHNVLLQAWAELGIGGVVLLLAGVGGHFRAAWREMRFAQRLRDPERAALVLAVVCMLAVLAGLSVNGDVLSTKSAWFVLGLVQAVAVLGGEERARRRTRRGQAPAAWARAA